MDNDFPFWYELCCCECDGSSRHTLSLVCPVRQDLLLNNAAHHLGSNPWSEAHAAVEVVVLVFLSHVEESQLVSFVSSDQQCTSIAGAGNSSRLCSDWANNWVQGHDIMPDLRRMCPSLTLPQLHRLTEHHHDDWIVTGEQSTETILLLDNLKRIDGMVRRCSAMDPSSQSNRMLLVRSEDACPDPLCFKLNRPILLKRT